MSQAAVPKARLGFRLCACGHENHYKKAACESCGAPNVMIADPPALTAGPQLPGPLDEPFGPVVMQTTRPDNVEALPTAAVVVEPYVVMQDFKCQLGDVMGVFKARMVLTDYAQIQALLAAGNPIAPVSKSSGLTCCPACQHVFPLMGNATGPKPRG